MGILDKFRLKTVKKPVLHETESNFIYTPIPGEMIPLEEIQDGVFSEGILGKGCGIKPTEGKVYAPFHGKIINIAETRHAICILSNNGIELIIHVGMDTVSMEGKGFDLLVKEGDRVQYGQLIMTFSVSEIQAAGFETISAVVVVNSQQYANIELFECGMKNINEKIMQVIR